MNDKLEIIKTSKGYVYEVYAGTYEPSRSYKDATIYFNLRSNTKESIEETLKEQGYDNIEYQEVDVILK